MLTIIKKAAAVCDRIDALGTAIHSEPVGLPHLKVTRLLVCDFYLDRYHELCTYTYIKNCPFPLAGSPFPQVADVWAANSKKGGKKKKKPDEASVMDSILTEDAKGNLAKAQEIENNGVFRSSLDGEEMKQLWKHRVLVANSLIVNDPESGPTSESQTLRDQIVKMMDLWDEFSKVVLSLDWDSDRSEECELLFRAWRDHIHNSFGPQVSMPPGEDFMDCMPVHYGSVHLREHAHELWEAYGIPIGCLTDQAGEQYNQLVKADITAGQGSSTNGRMSAATEEWNGKKAYTNNKFWLEMHRLYRIFFNHSSSIFNRKPRAFKTCPVCNNRIAKCVCE